MPESTRIEVYGWVPANMQEHNKTVNKKYDFFNFCAIQPWYLNNPDPSFHSVFHWPSNKFFCLHFNCIDLKKKQFDDKKKCLL